jgi:hypothetical protein
MNEAQTWLPPGAGTAAAEAAVAAMVGRWSVDWFAGHIALRGAAFVSARDSVRPLRNMFWQRCGPGAALGVTAGGTEALGARALDVVPEVAERTPADLKMLRALGGKCIEDLQQKTAVLLGLDGEWRETGEAPAAAWQVLRLELHDDRDGAAVALALAPGELVRLIRASLPAAPALPPLANPARALAPVSLHVSALLRGCRLTLAEVEALVPGDVVVLDARTDQLLPLAIDHAPSETAGCTIVASGDHLALQLAQAPIG